jgi:peroxiredoxin
MKLLFTIIGIVVHLMVYSGECHVFGRDISYAGTELDFYVYSDPITQTPVLIGTCSVRSDGTFKGLLSIDKTNYVFTEIGSYHLYFYAEPNQNYQLVLPEYKKQNEADEVNPFWEPEYIHLGIKGMEKYDLNYLILDFDYYFNRYLDERIVDIIAKGMKSDVDTFINEIDAEFPSGHHPYFDSYKNYRFAMLRYIAYERNVREVSFRYFAKDSVCYNNPSYSDLFNKIYQNFLDDELLLPSGPLIYQSIVYGHSIRALKRVLARKMELKNDRFRELVILKGIYDAFYNDNYAWTPLLLTLDSLCIATPYLEHKQIGQLIADKVLSMASGTVAPIFALPDSSGNIVKLNDLKHEFLYLSFINTNSFTCQQQLDLLKILHTKHSKFFKVVSIVVDNDVAKAKKFFRNKNYNWTVLYAPDNEALIKQYKVAAYPTYFLVGPSGELILSPAPSPLENFERIFFSITRQ